MLQKFVKIAVPLTESSGENQWAGCLLACPSLTSADQQIQYTYKFNWKKEGDLPGVALPIINMSWLCVFMPLHVQLCNTQLHILVIFNVKLRDTLDLLKSVFLRSVYICPIYSLLQQIGLYWTLLQKATQFSKQRNSTSLQMSMCWH